MGLMNADREFHSILARASRNKLLEQILQRLHEQSLRFWFISLSDPAHLKGVDAEHWEVLHALEARDASRAEAATRAHIESFAITSARVGLRSPRPLNRPYGDRRGEDD